MRRVSQQIGWSQESKLYYEWLVQLERLTAILGKNITSTTTTTTTAPPNFVSPELLFDFYQNTQYANGNTSIADLSGNGNDGTPTEGTGNGTPESINNSGVVYNPTTGTMDFSSNVGSQHQIKLPDQFKFTGTAPYTITMWFKRSAIPLNGEFQGLVAYQGNDGGFFGLVTNFTNLTGTLYIDHQRFNLSTSIADSISTTFGAGGVLPFSTGLWYMVSFGFDGTDMYTALYDTNGSRIDTSIPSTAVVKADASWGSFLGLRYNQWLNGTSFGVLAIHDTWIGTTNTDIIYNSTKNRYGY